MENVVIENFKLKHSLSWLFVVRICLHGVFVFTSKPKLKLPKLIQKEKVFQSIFVTLVKLFLPIFPVQIFHPSFHHFLFVTEACS